MRVTTFTALRHKNFRLFFAGQAVSLIGTWMQSLAQGWLVLKLTNSAFYLSLVQAMGSLPILFFSLFGGVVADRVDKRRLLLVTQAMSGILALVLGILVGLDVVRVWHVIALAGFLGVVNTFDIPGRQAFIVDMVGKDDLMNGIALNSALFNGARIVGPAIAGVLIGEFGLAPCFFINAASYLAIIVMLAMMKIEPPETKRERTPVFRELKDGLVYVKSEPRVMWLIFMVAVTSLIGMPYVALMPIFARDILHVGAKGLGLLMGCAGVGAVTGALTLASFGAGRNKGATAFVAAYVASAALLLFSFSRVFVVSNILIAIVGWGMITQFATINTTIQREVPDALRGRVMSLYILVFMGFMPIGNLIVGAAAHYFGTPAAVAMSASASILIYTALFVTKRGILVS